MTKRALLSLALAVFAAHASAAGNRSTVSAPVVHAAIGTGASAPAVGTLGSVPSIPGLGTTLPVGGVDIRTGVPSAIQPGVQQVSKAAERGSEGPHEQKPVAPVAKPADAVTPQGEQKDEAGASSEAPQTGAAQPSDETAKADGDVKFDNASKKTDDSASAVRASLGKRLLAKVGLTKGEPEVKTAFDKDEFGGPQKLDLGFKGNVKYGARWGLSLVGIATAIQLALGPLFEHLPWQLHVGKGVLQGAGRVELLTRMGPDAILPALASHPIQFLLLNLPMATAWEEVMFRALSFGVTFLVLAALKPAALGISRGLEKVPELFGLRAIGQTALGAVARISAHAFPIALAWSSFRFMTSHFQAWGVDPTFMAVHFSLGAALAYVAYKTRSLTSAIAAHYTYNLLSLLGALAALHFGLLGQVYSMALSVVSLAGLYLHWRSYRKAKGAAVAQAKLNLKNGVVALLLAGMLGGAVLAPSAHNGMTQARQSAPAGWVMQDAQNPMLPKNQQAPAKPDTTKPETKPDEEDPLGQLPPEIRQQLEAMFGMGSPNAPQKVLSEQAKLVARVKPAVVEVRLPTGLGSGYVVSKDGLLLTNAHVAEGAPGGVVMVIFENGMRGPAKVVALNKDKDIALIQLPPNPNGWPFVEIGDMNTVSEGDEVLAMGHPRGLPFTVTKGIVSGLGANRGNLYVQHLQTDASINPGNSGGPLFNMQGQVIGMNTQIATASGGSDGLGFAITAKDLKNAVEQFRATGNINSAWLGIIVDMTTPDVPEHGVAIEQVRPGSPAAKAGLKPGDVILGAEGRMFADREQAVQGLAAMIAHKKPGEPLAVAVARADKVGVQKIVLSDKKPE